MGDDKLFDKDLVVQKWGYHDTVIVEDLYQAFKARLIRELFPPMKDGERKGPFDVEVVPLKADATAGRGSGW